MYKILYETFQYALLMFYEWNHLMLLQIVTRTAGTKVMKHCVY